MSGNSRVRVAVTGLGVKSPAGVTVASAFDATAAGRGLAQRVDAQPELEVGPFLACRVPTFEAGEYFSRREHATLDRSTLLGVAAAVDAFHDSGLDSAAGTDRWSVSCGTGGSGPASAAESATRAWVRDRSGISVFTVPMLMPSAVAARASIKLGLTGPTLTYATACASGATAIGEAYRAVRAGHLDVAIAGGVEACLSPLVMESFRRVGAMSVRFDDPAGASRPFDVDRDGFVMAEGAAFVVLEEWHHAARRGARIYAELAGYGSNSDGFHIVAPRSDGAAAARCMVAALDDARTPAADIGHVNAHGTSTLRNDEAEASAIAIAFGSCTPPVTSVKGVTGHMFGGSGAFEAVVTALSVATGTVPPTANHHRQSGESKLDVVTSSARCLGPAPAISNSFGFGGHNVTLVFRPV
jgi:3-oxoacyl-[acyl-carrier-protein] synthase II